MTAEEYEQILEDMRGVIHPCNKCDGWGVAMYGTTATWRGGIGGATPTLDICNKCWGSGDKDRPWPSHSRGR